MAKIEQLAVLRQGAGIWNAWRGENPSIRPDLAETNLSGINLSEALLTGAILSKTNLSRANLSSAFLAGADLEGADLSGADLSRSYLSGAILRGVNLRGANLSHANLSGVDLSDANLSLADLSSANLASADLSKADLNGANLRRANFGLADLSNVELTNVGWELRAMRGCYLGVRGLDSCFGNALFKRAAADQDFLDTLESHLKGSRRMFLFRAWGIIDYGRSLVRVAVLSFGLAALYGAVYRMVPGILNYQQSAKTWFTPYYFSIVTYTTLGFGDVRRRVLPARSLS